MKDESARPGALPNQTHPHRNPLTGRGVGRRTNCGWIEVCDGVVTIDRRLRTKPGMSHSPTALQPIDCAERVA